MPSGRHRLAIHSRGLASSPPWERVAHVGESGLLLRFGTSIDMEVNKRVIACLSAFDQASPLSGVQDMLPGYASLLLHYDPLTVSSAEVEQWCTDVAAVQGGAGGGGEAGARVVTIPVHYGGEYGPDIEEAARIAGLGSAAEVAAMHAAGEYRVYFLGFTGGFPYLGGLHETLQAVPRLQTPRQAVPKGAVGIAAGQTGVYTIQTPGGWHVLGRTSETLFDPRRDPPALLRAGDLVKARRPRALHVRVRALGRSPSALAAHAAAPPWWRPPRSSCPRRTSWWRRRRRLRTRRRRRWRARGRRCSCPAR